MANLRRVVVGLKRHENSDTVIPAKFLECIVNFFLPHELSVKVSLELGDDMLVLSPANLKIQERYNNSFSGKNNLSSVVLQHSPDCPVLRLSDDEAHQLSEKVCNQGVYVAVSVILESVDNKILLTQRADHMRAFPRVWVPPGGNLECGETLFECAFRELKEETGLRFDIEASQLQFLGCWESVFPVLLGFGVPKSHHVVAYFHLQSQETWEELQTKIKLDPEEVQACAWLDEQNVECLFGNISDKKKTTKFSIEHEGNMKSSELDLSSMFHSSLWQQKEIYSGIQFALHHWLLLCRNRKPAVSSKM